MPSEQPRWAGRSIRLFRPAEEGGRALSATMSLCQFYREYVEPVVLAAKRAAPRNIDQYRQSLAQWRELTGDPPLEAIDEYTCAAFVEGLSQRPGRDGGPISPNTIRKHCVHLQRCLDLAGPRTRGNRSAKALLSEAPYLERPPQQEKAAEDCFTLAEISQWLSVCYLADQPLIPGLLPSRWWQALILTLYNTGLRIKTAIGLEWSMIEADWLLIPPRILKGNRGQRLWLNEAARDAIAGIDGQPPRKLIFPWPYREAWLHTCRRRLLAETHIPADRRFGFHALRKALNNQLWAQDPLVAQRVLGHRDLRTTREHYTRPGTPDGQVQRALEQIPQPEARGEGLGARGEG